MRPERLIHVGMYRAAVAILSSLPEHSFCRMLDRYANTVWPATTTRLLGFPNRVTASGGIPEEGLARLDVWVGSLMDELKRLGITETRWSSSSGN